MTQRRMMVAGNWKMHGNRDSATRLATGIRDGLADLANCDVLVCPPAVHLDAVRGVVDGSPLALGAQNVADHGGEGAYTGEVNGEMLVDCGCSHVLVGHSERRAMYGDTDERVAARFEAAQAAGLIPVLCVGETLEEREAGRTNEVLGRQIAAVLDHCGVQAFSKAVVAYEPVWAIGTGLTASPEQAQEVHAHLRAQIADDDAIIAARLSILYGGSVKPDNANALFSGADVDGGLIGGAALKSDSFLEICNAAEASVTA